MARSSVCSLVKMGRTHKNARAALLPIFEIQWIFFINLQTSSRVSQGAFFGRDAFVEEVNEPED